MSEILIGFLSIAIAYFSITGIGYAWLRFYRQPTLAVYFFELETFGCGSVIIMIITIAIVVSYGAGSLIKTLFL